VIINVGTNNANGNDQVEYAYKNMTDIVNSIWSFDGMADTCVVLSTLLHTDHSQGKVHRLSINNAYRNVVANRAAAGKCIYLADAEPAGAGSTFMALDQNIYVPTENPKIHPTVRDPTTRRTLPCLLMLLSVGRGTSPVRLHLLRSDPQGTQGWQGEASQGHGYFWPERMR
jgi:hypothetical protein